MHPGNLANRCQRHDLIEATSTFRKRKGGATNGIDLTSKVNLSGHILGLFWESSGNKVRSNPCLVVGSEGWRFVASISLAYAAELATVFSLDGVPNQSDFGYFGSFGAGCLCIGMCNVALASRLRSHWRASGTRGTRSSVALYAPDK